ncbi:heme exporter protein CcmD [Marinomonas agarivorans]|nr:heme exporter protein CcmD [Marinomonas agarivorans]
MAFESFSEFLAMGTHGPYVWSVYGITGVFLVGMVLQTLSAKKKQLKRLHSILVKDVSEREK